MTSTSITDADETTSGGAEDTRTLEYLRVTIDWLKRAQDASKDGGVSALYSWPGGWRSSYPETTGYIIPTMLNAWMFFKDADCLTRSQRMADWLLSLQNTDGAFPGRTVADRVGPCVFNTGQILFGLLRMWDVSRQSRYLDAAVRAGRWLVSVQEPGGEWSRYDFLNKSHAYNTRTAWALILLAERTDVDVFRRAAATHLAWVKGLTDEDGFIRRCAFDANDNSRSYGFRESLQALVKGRNWPGFYTKASLHTIAYAIQGMLECAWLLKDNRAESLARTAAAALAAHARSGRLAGYYGPGWIPESSSLCLTGTAQMAIIWLRLAEHEGNEYLAAAVQGCRLVREAQKTRTRNDAKRGAIAGSAPLHGLYLPFRFPNWAAKFAADAYLLLLALRGRPELLHQLRFW